MAKADFYETLGVAREADEKALKSAYRKLAMQFHPDRNPDNAEAEAKFKEVNEAYETLKDPQKRAAYDRFGHAAFENGGMGGGGGGFGAAGGFSDIFEDIFGEMMGGGRARRGGRERGADLRYNMEITLEEAYEGKTAQIHVPSSMTCEVCNGSGSKPGSDPVTCSTCGGAGRVRAASGFFSIERTCPTCNGRGQTIEDPCTNCHGQGRVTQERSLSVNIPAGIEDGTRIRLAGEGEAGMRGGPAGDLYIFIEVKEHDIFVRDGKMLACQVPVSMVVAALGGEVEVPTIDGGRARVKVPAGSQTGRQMRLRGKGMPPLRHGAGAGGEAGDMLIELTVETPVNLTSRQRDLLRDFQSEKADNSPQSSSFFNKVKGFWDDMTS